MSHHSSYREVHHFHHNSDCDCRRCHRPTAGELLGGFAVFVAGEVISHKLEEHNRREEARLEARRRLLGE